jgi:hypothetical protein
MLIGKRRSYEFRFGGPVRDKMFIATLITQPLKVPSGTKYMLKHLAKTESRFCTLSWGNYRQVTIMGRYRFWLFCFGTFRSLPQWRIVFKYYINIGYGFCQNHWLKTEKCSVRDNILIVSGTI